MSDTLKDVVLIVTDTEETAEGSVYPVTHVYRFDYEGEPDALYDHVCENPQIVESTKMTASENENAKAEDN